MNSRPSQPQLSLTFSTGHPSAPEFPVRDLALVSLEAPCSAAAAHLRLLLRTRRPSLGHESHRVEVAVHALGGADLLRVVEPRAGLDDAAGEALVGDFLRRSKSEGHGVRHSACLQMR